jgi:hypothetical protein
MPTDYQVRRLDWHPLADLPKFKYGFVPISGHRGQFVAVDGRMNLKAELSLIRALRPRKIGTDPAGSVPRR